MKYMNPIKHLFLLMTFGVSASMADAVDLPKTGDIVMPVCTEKTFSDGQKPLQEMRYLKSGTLDYKILYEYDEVGNMLREEWQQMGPDEGSYYVTTLKEYEYDTQGHVLLEAEYKNLDCNMVEREYDDAGLLTKLVTSNIYNGYRSIKEQRSWEHDAEGRVTSEKYYLPDYSSLKLMLFSETCYVYDAQGDIIEESKFYFNAEGVKTSGTRKKITEWDDKGRPTHSESARYSDNGSWTVNAKEIFTYDERGNMKRYEQVSYDSWRRQWYVNYRIFYSFDDYGNVLTAEISKKEGYDRGWIVSEEDHFEYDTEHRMVSKAIYRPYDVYMALISQTVCEYDQQGRMVYYHKDLNDKVGSYAPLRADRIIVEYNSAGLLQSYEVLSGRFALSMDTRSKYEAEYDENNCLIKLSYLDIDPDTNKKTSRYFVYSEHQHFADLDQLSVEDAAQVEGKRFENALRLGKRWIAFLIDTRNQKLQEFVKARQNILRQS